MTTIKAEGYPLAWPAGWKRTAPGNRRYGHFGKRRASQPGGYAMLQDITISEGVNRVLDELKRMGVPDYQVIISTNLQLRRDGLPRSDQRAPVDPGAAVYWLDGAAERCIAVDQYTKVEDNLAAIAATLDAMRAIERHGGAEILNRAFSGFTALPAPGQTSRTWRDVLGVGPEEKRIEVVREKYRRLCSIHHPDKGGTDEQQAELNSAWAQAQEALR